MAAISSFKALAIVFVAALLSAAASAQSTASSPAPPPDVGAAGAVSASVALIGASVITSMLAIMKH